MAIQDRAEASQGFIQRFRLSFPNAPDPGGKVSIDYGVYGVPETFVIDKAGIVRYKQIGPLTSEALEKKILPLVRELQR